jgi:CheY-like chemotaxis protein
LKLRILVVEDEPILALELKEDLQDLGFDVADVIHDGDMVLHTYLKCKPDAVVMDIKLHGFRDGVEAAGQLRVFYSTPIVFVSSYAKAEMAERLTRFKSFSYLQKPYEPQALKEAILSLMAAKA